MLLISWNVAGLSTTLTRIDKDYSHSSITAEEQQQQEGQQQQSLASSVSVSVSVSASSKKRSRSRSHAFSHYLKRHGDPEILCVQEHKIPFSQLSSRSEPFGCSSIEGYESFWACCVDKSKKGFNGVMTYAKTGITQYANARPFGCDELDDQGRAVMTDHGDFVVFNVYVPASCGMPLSYKMKFLNALQTRMREQRQKNKKVILVGDLNIAHKGIDVYWMYRPVRINDVQQEVRVQLELKQGGGDTNAASNVPRWKQQVAQHWETIEAALSNIEVVPVTTQNVATGAKFEKYKARVTLGKSGSERKVYLGSHEATADACLSYFNFGEMKYHDRDLDKECISRDANVISLDRLAELMAKIAGIDWDAETMRLIANSDGLKRSSPTVKWLDSIIECDEMVDAFRHVFPNAHGRFTCWMQFTNQRFENVGSRIDYTLVDEPLVKYIDNVDSQKLRCCKYSHAEEHFESEEAALHAAIASGMFQGAGFGGGGIASATQEALDTQFIGSPHTGIIYTAPQYSDHVPVSVLFNEQFDEKLISTSLILNGKDTKNAQPHKKQQSISTFFTNRPSSNHLSSASSSSGSKRSVNGNVQNSNKKSTKGTLFSHFGNKK